MAFIPWRWLWWRETCQLMLMIVVSFPGGMTCLIWRRELQLAALLSSSLSWSSVAAVVAAAASPTDRTTGGWSSHDLLLALLSWQTAPTSSFLCSRWPKVRETLCSLQKPISKAEYLFITAHPWQMRSLGCASNQCQRKCFVRLAWRLSWRIALIRSNKPKCSSIFVYFDHLKTNYY